MKWEGSRSTKAEPRANKWRERAQVKWQPAGKSEEEGQVMAETGEARQLADRVGRQTHTHTHIRTRRPANIYMLAGLYLQHICE